MNNKPLISIVVPVFNSAKFLQRSLESILSQTYTNIEIVVVDDASTDNSWQIIQDYAINDSRIKAFTIPFVDGPKVTRDNAIRRASGDWIVPIDSDDSIEPHYIEKLWNRHIETDAEFVGSKMVKVDEEDNFLGHTIPDNNFDFDSVYSGTEAMLRILSSWQFSANGALWKRSVMTNICPENTYHDYADEYDTRVYVNNCQKVAFVDAEYYYTHNIKSCTHKVSFNSMTIVLFNKIKLKNYFDDQYGYGCALSLYFEFSAAEEYRRIFPSIAKISFKNKKLLSDDIKQNLSQAYHFYRNQYIKTSYIEVQYYRFLWFLLRKSC